MSTFNEENKQSEFEKVYDFIQKLESNDFTHEKITPRHIKSILDEVQNIILGEKELQKSGELLVIGIVGQVKAGKSSFLNALLFEGEEVLPKAATPMTAGLSVIEYAEKPYFEVEFYSKDDWSKFEDDADVYDKTWDKLKRGNPDWSEEELDEETKRDVGSDEICSAKELIKLCGRDAKLKIGKDPYLEDFENLRGMHERLKDFVGAGGTYTAVTKSLFLYLDDERLKGLQIVDTPGVNDPIVSREERTKQFLRTCHGVFLLSSAPQFCTGTDMDFLKDRINSQGIDTVVFLASRYDSALQEVGNKIKDIHQASAKLERTLKKSLEDALRNTDYKGKKPIFDFTSGLCFSLYKKEETYWDSNEEHQYKSLKDIFPDAFINAEKASETLKDLSNIEFIREEYINKLFFENKERIIQDKIKQYYNKNSSMLKLKIESATSEIENERSILINADLSKTKEDKVAYEKAFSKLNDDFKYFFDSKKDDLQNIAKRFKYYLKFEFSITVDSKSFLVKIKDGFAKLFRTEVTGKYKQIDLIKLEENLKNVGDEFIDKVQKDWELPFSKKGLFFTELQKFAFDKVNEIVEKEPQLDNAFLLNTINKTLKNIESLAFLDNAAELRDNQFPKWIKSNISCLPRYSPKYIWETEFAKEKVQDKISDESEKNVIKTKTEVETVKIAVLDKLNKIIDKSVEDIANELSNLSKSFTVKLTAELNKNISQLEKDIADKENVLKIFDNYILITKQASKVLS